MTVPADVRGYIGRGEIHVSLREGECRKARLKAGLFAFEVRRLIELVRNAVKTLSDGEVRALVAGWRQRMVDKDSAIRRRIEAGLEPFDLDAYGENCAGVAGMLDEIMGTLSEGVPPQRAVAFAQAASCATGEDGDDFVPILAAREFEELDLLSQRTLMLAWLPAAQCLFDQKADACTKIGSRLVAEHAHA